MRHPTIRLIVRSSVAVIASVGLLLTGCGSDKKAAGDTSAATPAAADCSKAKLNLVNIGKLTIGTDSPAFPPWFSDDKPANGKGFESAVAYAVAANLGFSKDEVTWKVVKFDQSFAPGKKDFDFDINQVSIKDERRAAVDFSDGYYDTNQALVAFADSPAAKAKTLAGLKSVKLGAQQGTTSYDFITNVIKPDAEPLLYNDNNGAKAALNAKQIDGIVLDLPTAFYVSSVEIEGTKVVGQFETLQGGAQEQFGLVFEKGNALVGCVNQAIATLKSSGELAKIQQAELSDATSAPLIK